MKKISSLANRRGTVLISEGLLFGAQESFLVALFCQFFPYKIDTDCNVSTYYGMSPKFDEITEGQAVPQYEAFATLDGSNVTVSFKRVSP